MRNCYTKLLLFMIIIALCTGCKKNSAGEKLHKSDEIVLKLMEQLKKPSVQCDLLYDSKKISGYSKIGGMPDVPGKFAWPGWKNRPLAFLAQINLKELGAVVKNPDLPESGMLYFFYDAEEQTWGYDPADIGSWRVIYSDKTTGLRSAALPPGIKKELVFKEAYINFKIVTSYPPSDSDAVLTLSDNDIDLYIEKTSVEGPFHRMFGYPDQIQNEMELECQLASHGINTGSSVNYSGPEVKSLKEGAKNWKLLFQIDSDEKLNMMWGDSGRLYFWYKTEAGKTDFDHIWMILQCY